MDINRNDRERGETGQRLRGDQIENTKGSTTWNQLQSFRYAGMRVVISVTLVPGPIAGNVVPIGHKPDFVRRVLGA
jgi:hypothetical protein